LTTISYTTSLATTTCLNTMIEVGNQNEKKLLKFSRQ